MDKIPAAICILVVVGSACAAASRLDYVAAGSSTCYRLELGAWSGPFPSGSPTLHQVPEAIRLDTVSLPAMPWPGHYQRAAPSQAPRNGRPERFPPHWRLFAQDSLEIIWTTGFGGVTLRLRQAHDALSGAAYAFNDVEGPGIVQPTAPVKGTRIDCPATLRL